MPTKDKRRGAGLALGVCALMSTLAGQPAGRALASDFGTCKFFSQLPDDCADAEQRKFDNLRGYRYEEFDLFSRDVIKKIPYVSVYNTTGQNAGEDTRDSAPKSFAEHVDPRRIAKQYHAVLAAVSLPRTWTIDWFVDRVGAVRNFDGLDAAWMGNGQAPEASLAGKQPSSVYHPRPVARTSILGFKKGSKVYLLDDPKGRTWVMVASTAKDSSGASLDALDDLGDQLKLPPGWKFRTLTLDKELVLEPKSGASEYVEDDKGDVYDLTGRGQSNFSLGNQA
jgi:hypothetical protein